MLSLRPQLSLLALSLLLAAGSAAAKPWWMRGIESNQTDFLPPDVAFRVGARLEGSDIRLRFVIAEGYYLYRARIAVAAQSPDLQITGLDLPAGVAKTDPYLGTQEIYLQQVDASAHYTRSDYGAHPLEIKVTYQGCAEAGLCYPPISKVLLPAAASAAAEPPAHAWEGIAIAGGACAFLLAGLLLRKGRRLELPPA